MLNNSIMAGLQEATRLTRAGQLQEATAMIQRALQGVPNQAGTAEPATASTSSSASASARSRRGETLEGSYRVVDDTPASAEKSTSDEPQERASSGPEASNEASWTRRDDPEHTPPSPFGAGLNVAGLGAGLPDTWREKLRSFRGPESWTQPFPGQVVPDSSPDAGQFSTGTFTNHAGTRDYKLYIPSGYHGQALPLVVMLHGCTQNPDDFAAGTGMNKLAEEQLCFVLYPAQPAAANSSKCWNWFKATDQQRERGEPAIIAGMTRQVLDEHRLDTQRVYVAGLSAGGAMATTLAMTYPDLYAAVGVHSGLPHAVAQDLPSALAAMQGGTGPLASYGQSAAASTNPDSTAGIPAVVFHGDRDTTVHPSNGDRVVAQYAPSSATRQASNDERGANVKRGRVPNGHAYTCTTHHDASGQPTVEQWLIHGAGHAWAGGSPHGSYTDPKGPDAAREMLRFFFAHPKTAESAG